MKPAALNPPFERATLSSRWIGEREVTIYSPAGTPASGALRRVLILFDGQNLFEPDRAHIPGGHWGVAETAEALIEAGRISPMLVVGVDHAGEDRIAELTPTSGDRDGAGQAWRYGRFIVEELLPILSRQHGARTDFDGVGLGGSSLGGLATLAVARQFPARFGRLLVMSPSVWWDRGVILRRLANVRLKPPPRVWLDVGLREGAGTVADARRLRDLLASQTSELSYLEDPEGDHSERSWARRLPAALGWLYGQVRSDKPEVRSQTANDTSNDPVPNF